jgi:S-adenosylmethionine:tRNA-ribosyltransferase-isomerase (queuine synthetase)
VSEGEGWTSLVVTPERGLLAIDGLLTGWHESESSHLKLLEAGPALLSASAPTERRSSTATSGTNSATST